MRLYQEKCGKVEEFMWVNGEKENCKGCYYLQTDCCTSRGGQIKDIKACLTGPLVSLSEIRNVVPFLEKLGYTVFHRSDQSVSYLEVIEPIKNGRS
jgi:hypothetical protein